MTRIVEAFRCRANALRLQAALAKVGVPSRVLSGDGAIWNVMVESIDHDRAYDVSLATLYI